MRTLFFFLLLSTFSVLRAQSDSTSRNQVKRNANDPLIFKSIRNTPDLIYIDYTLPFEGIVEFELRDAEEKVLWRNQYVGRPGDNMIKFSTKPLQEGKYFYSLYYKGVETRKYFDYRHTN